MAGGSIGINENGVVYIAAYGRIENIVDSRVYVSQNHLGYFVPELLGIHREAMNISTAYAKGTPGGAVIVFTYYSGDGKQGNRDVGYYGSSPTGIFGEETLLPEKADLCFNYPNPFNAQTVISVGGWMAGELTVDIYDLMGRKVRTLVSHKVEATPCKLTWDGCSDSGVSCPSGLYFYKVNGSGLTYSGKMTLLK